MSEDILKDLMSRFFRGEINDEEREMLAQWINQQDDDALLSSVLENNWLTFHSGETLSEESAKTMLNQIVAKAKQEETKKTKVIRGAFWKRVAVAASVLLAVGIGEYLFFNKNNAPQQMVQMKAKTHDVKSPETNRATITLADGQQIFLDSAGDGSLSMQGSVQVKLKDGKIDYQFLGDESGKSAPVMYNTLSNPRGSKVVNMQLTDGSQVWLNAGSSITFPVAFLQKERKVTIDGEGYFEIAHDISKPFYVSKGTVEVKVLGTHFNVNAYGDERQMKVTLLEGSVRVKQSGDSDNAALLKPGEQALIGVDQVGPQTIVIQQVNTEQVMAWKNGLFSFDQTGLKDVMRQLSRWYNVEIVYQGDIPDLTFGGDIQRTLDLSQILEALSRNGIHFNINGNKIIITP